MACDYRVSPLFKRIQRAAMALVRIYETAGALPKLSSSVGPCADCGRQSGLNQFCWEHRDYSDALRVRRVCSSCNKRSKKAVATVIDPDTLEAIPA